MPNFRSFGLYLMDDILEFRREYKEKKNDGSRRLMNT